MTLSGKKIALFVEKFFEDLELWYPYYRLQEAGAEVVIIGPKVETYYGKYGVPAQAHRAIHKVTVSEFDALIIPGGYSPDHMRRVPAMITFTTEMHRQGKIVATICHGGWMLASAGIVQGKKVTGFFSIKDDLINAGAQWLDQEVVYDNGIITSRTPADLPAFCREIIRVLGA